MSRIVVYTSITGGMEPERDDIIVMNQYDRFKSDRMNAKIYKLLPHLFFPEAEITIWLDGNIRFADGINLDKFVDEFLGEYDMAAYAHPYRHCLYDEAAVCILDKKDDPEIIREQVGFYITRGYPRYEGLAECGVLVRKNTPIVNAFNEAWWAQVCRFSSRDQISFMWSLPYGLRYVLRAGNVRDDERFIYTKRPSSKP